MDYKDYLEQNKATEIHFWYQARMNLIAFLLQKTLLSFDKDRQILDIGCGTGTELLELSKYGQVTAVDKCKEALSIIDKDKYMRLEKDVEIDDLGTSQYDCICAFDILEHLEKDELVLSKIQKALKPGGKFIYTVPAFQFLYGSHDIALEHHRRYSKRDLSQKLKEQGLTVSFQGYWNFVLFPLMAFFRLVKMLKNKIIKDKEHKTEVNEVNKILNFLLFKIMSVDLFLIKKGIRLPFGLSVFGVALREEI